jgi:hypothetical protein
MTAAASAAPIAFTNESEFVAAVEARSLVYVTESFEDGEVWGGVRSDVSGTFSAPAITNFSLRMTANTNTSNITTSQGPPRTGEWGAYSLPHGSYATGIDCHIPGNCGDGLLITCKQPIYAFSAWVTGFSNSKLKVVLNGDRANPVDFPEICDTNEENCINYGLLGNGHKFFGVLDPDGFACCELREIEGKAEDQKFIWCDDFIVAFSNVPPPRIRSVATATDTATFRFKELAVHGSYALETIQSLLTNDWSEVDSFTASTTETNRTVVVSNAVPNTFFRLFGR